MFSLLFRVLPDNEDLLVADLWECGTLGIVTRDDSLQAFFDSSEDPAPLLARFASFRPDVEQEANVDWEQKTRDAWPPLPLGHKLYLVAPWNTEMAPEGRLRLEIEPGMACGTGRHPATQLCLEALERQVRPGMQVIDIGTGSGILAKAATLLGAGRAVGCDIDYDAVAIAQGRVPQVFTGSADAIRSGSADLIVANIDAAGIEAIARELARIRRAGAAMILSGFREDDQPEGFPAREVFTREGWACLVV